MGNGQSIANYERQLAAAASESKRESHLKNLRGKRGRRGLIYTPVKQGLLQDVDEIMIRHNEFRDIFNNSPVSEFCHEFFTSHFNKIYQSSCPLAVELLGRCLVKHSYPRHSIILNEGQHSQRLLFFEKGEAYSSINKQRVRDIKCPVTYHEWLIQGGKATEGKCVCVYICVGVYLWVGVVVVV